MNTGTNIPSIENGRVLDQAMEEGKTGILKYTYKETKH